MSECKVEFMVLLGVNLTRDELLKSGFGPFHPFSFRHCSRSLSRNPHCTIAVLEVFNTILQCRWPEGAPLFLPTNDTLNLSPQSLVSNNFLKSIKMYSSSIELLVNDSSSQIHVWCQSSRTLPSYLDFLLSDTQNICYSASELGHCRICILMCYWLCWLWFAFLWKWKLQHQRARNYQWLYGNHCRVVNISCVQYAFMGTPPLQV